MLENIFKGRLEPKAIIYPVLMLSAMWLVFGLQSMGWFNDCSGAIIPLVPEGLYGILFSPLLHGGIDHIFGNSIPIFALMFLLFQFYPKVANTVFISGWLASGFIVWLLPPIDIFTGLYRHICIVGASGLVYVLAAFLFFSGIFKWNMKLLSISLIVALYYGSLIWGVFPQELFSDAAEASRISWQSHLAGAVVGSILAFIFRKVGEKRKKFIWEYPNYYSERDDVLWQEYKRNNPEDFSEMPYKKEESIWEYLDHIRKNHP